MTAPPSAHALGRRVVVVETEEPYALVPECLPLLDAGYDVVLCAGPRSDQTCPILDGLPCPLVDEADIVINAVADRVAQTAIAEGLHSQAAEVPLALIAAGDGHCVHASGSIRFPTMQAMSSQLCRVRRGRTRTQV
jgi:hypothetical protein